MPPRIDPAILRRGHIKGHLMDTHTIDRHGVRLVVRIGDPFTACEVDEARESHQCRVHPHLTRLPGGRLILSANIDGDIGGAELVTYASDDSGLTWRAYGDWPRIGGAFATMDNGVSLMAADDRFFATGEPHVYVLPTRRSTDGGLTWGPTDGARVDLPLAMEEPIDWYDPPAWFLDRTMGGQSGRQWRAKWQKLQPTTAEQQLRDQFGRRTLNACLMQIFPLAGEKALAFVYLTQQWGDAGITVCLASDDAGRSWAHLSTPGAYDPRFATHGYLRHPLDGLCEPSCTRLAGGDLLLVMRMGSFHPLHTTCSTDQGRTWAPQADQRPGCHFEGWPARPIAVSGILPTVLTLPDGTLALCTGRPDVTLSFSFDNGYHWPWTYRFIEDNKPEEQSTYNNTMVQVAPNRLLLMYDHGDNSGKIPEYNGPRRILGHFVDVEVKR